MKVLLDECLPKKLGGLLIGHEVYTTHQMGWDGLKNGKLLGLAQKSFDVFVASDQNLQYQNILKRYSIAVVVLRAKDNRIESYLAFSEKIRQNISKAQKSKVIVVSVQHPHQ